MSGPRLLAVAVLLSCGACAACGRSERSPATTPPVAAGVGSARAPAAESPEGGVASAAGAASTSLEAALVSADGGPAEWVEMVRDERWEAAWRALEALPEHQRARAELRYVRARVALAREQPAVALQLVEGLETELPLLADDIGRRRAEARLAVGPYAEAGEWFALHAGAAFQLDAARAFEKAGDARRAHAAAERVLLAPRHTRAQEAEARALRVRVAPAPDDPERADARWLATRGADVSPVDSVALLSRLDPRHPLTAEELLVRARTLADAGRTDDALKVIESAAGAPGADKVSALERARAKGTALFRAHGRYTEAAKTLAECAAAGGPHAAEDAFHAARAQSRADRDEEAIRGYEDVRRRFPRSPWAEAAAFFAPYLRMLHGEWRECAAGFDAYARAHTGGEHERDARRDGGLCKLLSGDPKGARLLFERLIDDERADPLTSARAADMAALAALRDGDRTHAVALWTDVARTRALTWPALVARARLAEAGAPLPPVVDPPPEPADAALPLAVTMPPPADMLHRVGFEQDAEREIAGRESAVVAGAGSRQAEALCAVYGELTRARRRYQIGQTLPSS
ncbi:MAG: hypothetical protein JOZ69_12625, partial [Myxococcales bacterium]|nr:hypothetical protein [Myxococcales bacterium]